MWVLLCYLPRSRRESALPPQKTTPLLLRCKPEMTFTESQQMLQDTFFVLFVIFSIVRKTLILNFVLYKIWENRTGKQVCAYTHTHKHKLTLWHSGIIKVTHFLLPLPIRVCRVLSQHDVCSVWWPYALQYLHLQQQQNTVLN